ncbi:unnamed protein product [Ostreobium quekettii]|uniref:Uncharacterized protein n=1 Tax=Ostreobium quekettii TaxID=121088 RepID=A0A8S1ILD7_9CHLO|nr:unnamed protein product [Ostreobium quekettii]|eukprot:evm.model.scf_253EXC.1 EVM.evm.TU.scf_253EXC.1   scf_253EXC:600-1452(+)
MASTTNCKAYAPCASKPVGQGNRHSLRGCCSARLSAFRRADPTVTQFVTGSQSLRLTTPCGVGKTALQSTNFIEVAQLAEVETGLIFKVAGILFGITLVGLAIGFVLLRVESLVEEKKIKL